MCGAAPLPETTVDGTREIVGLVYYRKEVKDVAELSQIPR
jgi:hypothetical protein